MVLAMVTGKRSFRVVACLAAVVLGDWLFYGQTVGWTLGLFALGLILLLTLRHTETLTKWAGRLALLFAAAICLALIEEPTFLAILMTILALGFLVMLRTGDWVTSVRTWAARWAHLLITLPIRSILDSFLAMNWFRRHPGARPALFRALIVWVLPALGGIVFIVLFALANPLISEWFSQLRTLLSDWLEWLPELVRPDRILLWIFLTIAVYGLLRHQLSTWKLTEVCVPPIQRPERATHTFVIRCLLVFNAVFAVQTILDLIYLYGGAQLPSNMTYATYAHRGAYPLVATALLAGVFVLLTFRTGGAAHRSAWARRLVYLWIAQNVMLLVSTIWRLLMYVDAYSLSRWRVAAMIWIALVAFGFALTLWKISRHRTNAWLLRANLVSLAAVLYVCGFLNFGGVIADFNVRHCREVTGQGVPLDVAYLQRLGVDALPALQWVIPRLEGRTKHDVVVTQAELHKELDEKLSDWRGWTFRRQRLAQGAAPRIESSARY